jgi:hypothetical protein
MLMSSEPRCSLCLGHIAKEKGVMVGVGLVSYGQAWVCTQCSAVFPIAVYQKTPLFGVVQPLYTAGERVTDRSS